MASGGIFEDCKISDVFIVSTPKKKFDANKITFGGKYPYVARGDKNNGIRGYISESEEYLNNGNTISFGQDTATMFYQKDAYFTGDKIKIFTEKSGKLNDKNAQYLLSTMKKSFSLFSWGSSSFNEDILNNTIFTLPFIKNEIAFTYMDNFITELQAERLQELQAERLQELQGYLQVTGLSNYTLTEEEQRAIEGLKSTVEQEMFTMQDIFRITTSAKKFNAKDLSFDGIYPYVARTEKDNGIRGYITEDKKYLNPENTISFGQDTATMFYQKNAYFTGDKIKIFSLKNKNLNRSIALYLITRMKKSFSTFSWGSMFNEEVLNNTEIYLPINNGQIDYSKMELIISAVQKLVIADVVKYADRELSAYQSVIGK
uniref:Restriction enzyme BgcI subunit beta n=1 Tax=Haemophilus influenzae TaxID=727 RepID=A0AB37B3J8_HAEIF|nr:Restriction enzyme BgcI subunit beta [Haemophilus influenzae]